MLPPPDKKTLETRTPQVNTCQASKRESGRIAQLVATMPSNGSGYQATTYVAQISSAGEFGLVLRAEAWRRGIGWA